MSDVPNPPGDKHDDTPGRAQIPAEQREQWSLHHSDPGNYTDDPEVEALRALFGAWHITRGMFSGWKATWKSESGLMIREVHGTSVADLHRRLEVIENARGDSE